MVKSYSVDMGAWGPPSDVPDLTDSSNDELEEGRYTEQRPSKKDEVYSSSTSSRTDQVSETFKKLLINDSNMERQTVMKCIVRIVANMLITKFPIDECCNDRNYLMVNNMISFLEKVLTRSRIPLNQFLVASLYLFRCATKIHGTCFRNNGLRVCLRRLVITSLAVSSRHFGGSLAVSRGLGSGVRSSKHISVKQRILNQNLNTQVWATISGLKEADLERMVRQFGDVLEHDFRVSALGLSNFKKEIGMLVKLVISRDAAAR